MKQKLSLITFSVITLGVLLSACGGGSGDTATDVTTTSSGQLIDSYLENVDYTCADGSKGVTTENGTFSCQKLPVSFSLGDLQLGSIATLPEDRQVFPQDLLGLDRDDLNNTNVIAMARFLQSCDDDNNTNNGIQIQTQLKEKFQNQEEYFYASNLEAYANDANITLIDEQTAINHLENSLEYINKVDASNLPASVKDALLSQTNELTQTVKDTFSYMGNEERLAHDIYLNLYDYHLQNNDTAIKQLENIATRSETQHIQTVQLLVNKYISDPSEFSNIDLPELSYKDTNISDMIMGVYDISTIQDLYNTLYEKGIQSPQDALEVGCMVEVTDIDDLLTDISDAQENNATDIVTAFEFLRDGSYNHYWAFDKGLKNMGITEGCCSLGEKYCHPEYPQTSRGARR